MRRALVLVAVLLGGCVRADVITASPDEIAVSAQSGSRHNVEAGRLASEHCAKTGRNARLVGLDGGGVAAAFTTYGGGAVSTNVLRFACY